MNGGVYFKGANLFHAARVDQVVRKAIYKEEFSLRRNRVAVD